MGPGIEFLLDSVIVIDHLNGVPAAEEYLLTMGERAAISVITRAEVLTGFPREGRIVPEGLLGLFPLLPIDVEAADIAADLRREYRWKLPDAFQAALAQHHQLRLVTRNSKHFPPGRFSFVEIPYEI